MKKGAPGRPLPAVFQFGIGAKIKVLTVATSSDLSKNKRRIYRIRIQRVLLYIYRYTTSAGVIWSLRRRQPTHTTVNTVAAERRPIECDAVNNADPPTVAHCPRSTELLHLEKRTNRSPGFWLVSAGRWFLQPLHQCKHKLLEVDVPTSPRAVVISALFGNCKANLQALHGVVEFPPFLHG